MRQKNLKKRRNIERQHKNGMYKKERKNKRRQINPADRYLKRPALESFLRLIGLDNISIPYYTKQGFIEVGPRDTYRISHVGQIFFENFVNNQLTGLVNKEQME